MRSKKELLESLHSFASFIRTLVDVPEQTFLECQQDGVTIKKRLADMAMQDRMYLQHYFPHMKKGNDIVSYTKERLLSETASFMERHSAHEIVESFLKGREELIAFLYPLGEEALHAFFSIDNVSFTMYDHLEHLLFNDRLNEEQITAFLKRNEDKK